MAWFRTKTSSFSPDTFWALIEHARMSSDGTFDDRVEALRAQLSTLAADEVVSFQRHFESALDGAYSWDLWGAAYLVCGGCSDDGFADFRAWIISLGKDRYERALRDPESLANIRFGAGGEEDARFEEFAYVATEVYQAMTGRQMPLRSTKAPASPTGRRWNEDERELVGRYPRLANVRSYLV